MLRQIKSEVTKFKLTFEIRTELHNYSCTGELPYSGLETEDTVEFLALLMSETGEINLENIELETIQDAHQVVCNN